MWQQVFASLNAENFMIVAIAEESRGAESARPWIEQANTTYWNLIDPDHQIAALYGMVNVPQAVWIDEQGRIVRGPETAGSTEHFRRMDRVAKTMAPEDQVARLAARVAYMDALRDWVTTGRHALPGDAARAALPRITPAIAEAHAAFRLAVWLSAHGRAGEAAPLFTRASDLHPDSWNMWRQAADLDAVGKAGGPEFWARVEALGDRPYYPAPALPGFPPA